MDKTGTVRSNQKSQSKPASSQGEKASKARANHSAAKKKNAQPAAAQSDGSQSASAKNEGPSPAAAKGKGSRGTAVPKKTNSREQGSPLSKNGGQKAAAELVMTPAISSSIASSAGAMGSSVGSAVSGIVGGAQNTVNNLTAYFGRSSGQSPVVSMEAQPSELGNTQTSNEGQTDASSSTAPDPSDFETNRQDAEKYFTPPDYKTKKNDVKNFFDPGSLETKEKSDAEQYFTPPDFETKRTDAQASFTAPNLETIKQQAQNSFTAPNPEMVKENAINSFSPPGIEMVKENAMNSFTPTGIETVKENAMNSFTGPDFETIQQEAQSSFTGPDLETIKQEAQGSFTAPDLETIRQQAKSSFTAPDSETIKGNARHFFAPGSLETKEKSDAEKYFTPPDFETKKKDFQNYLNHKATGVDISDTVWTKETGRQLKTSRALPENQTYIKRPIVESVIPEPPKKTGAFDKLKQVFKTDSDKHPLKIEADNSDLTIGQYNQHNYQQTFKNNIIQSQDRTVKTGATARNDTPERIEAKKRQYAKSLLTGESPIIHPEGIFFNSKIGNKDIPDWLAKSLKESGLKFNDLFRTLELGPFSSPDLINKIEAGKYETRASGSEISHDGKIKSYYWFNWNRDEDGARTAADVTGTIYRNGKHYSDYEIKLDYLAKTGTVSITNHKGFISSLTKYPELYADEEDILNGRWAEIKKKKHYSTKLEPSDRSVELTKFAPYETNSSRGTTDILKLKMPKTDADGFPVGKPDEIRRKFSTARGDINELKFKSGEEIFTSTRQFDYADGPIKKTSSKSEPRPLPKVGNWDSIIATGNLNDDGPGLSRLSPEMVARINQGPPLGTENIFNNGGTVNVRRDIGQSSNNDFDANSYPLTEIIYNKDDEEIRWIYDNRNQPLGLDVKTRPQQGENGLTTQSELKFVGGDNPSGTFKHSYFLPNFDATTKIPNEMMPPQELQSQGAHTPKDFFGDSQSAEERPAPSDAFRETFNKHQGTLHLSYLKPLGDSIGRINYDASHSISSNSLRVEWKEVVKQPGTTPVLLPEPELETSSSFTNVVVQNENDPELPLASQSNVEKGPSNRDRVGHLFKDVVVGNIVGNINRGRELLRHNKRSNEDDTPSNSKVTGE